MSYNYFYRYQILLTFTPMTEQEIKKHIASRIKTLSNKQGKDDGSLSDRDWDIEQERVSAAINELTRLAVEIDRAR